MNKKPLKVAMICHFSNLKVQKKLKLKVDLLGYIARKIKGLSVNPYEFTGEYSVWVSNAIEEFEKMTDEIDLHLVTPHSNMSKIFQKFDINGIHYHFFQDENSKILTRLKRRLCPSTEFSRYLDNRKKIKKIMESVKPDLVYVIGIESPFYSLSVLDIPKHIPVVVQLQTLMSAPDFEKNYPISHDEYLYRSSIEANVIKRADYICTTVEKMRNIIIKDIKPNAVILKTKLAVGEKIFNKPTPKKYDFVYFAANINKAFDLALEAFALAYQKDQTLSLLVVGYYDYDYKKKIDNRMRQLGISRAITFTGRLPMHEDVLNKIREAKFALLPLKIDIISGTIREALANGLPVVTTITNGGTPILNEDRETVLLTSIGDHKSMACNMLRLSKEFDLANQMRENGFRLVKERYSNAFLVLSQKRALVAAYENFTMNVSIPQDLCS